MATVIQKVHEMFRSSNIVYNQVKVVWSYNITVNYNMIGIWLRDHDITRAEPTLPLLYLPTTNSLSLTNFLIFYSKNIIKSQIVEVKVRLTNKTLWPLLSELHAKRTRRVGFVAVAFYRYVTISVELFVCTAVVFSLRILEWCTLVTSHRERCKYENNVKLLLFNFATMIKLNE